MIIKILLAFALIISFPINLFGETYYVDYAGGNDTCDGTHNAGYTEHESDKACAWKSAPGMYSCSDICADKAASLLQPGDNVILKGGITWPNAALGWNLRGNGNATESSPGCSGSGCIYIGVDKTWYSGSSWSRPVLDAGGTAVNTNDGVVNVILYLVTGNYIILDNIEFTGLYWTGSPAANESKNLLIRSGSAGYGGNTTLTNLYFHGWSHDTYENGARSNSCCIMGDTGIPNNNVNTIVSNSVFDGSDTDMDSCSGIFGSPPYIEDNIFNNISNGMIVNGTVKIDGNTITNIVDPFDPSAHTNAIEINASDNVTVSNNIIGNIGEGAVGLWVAPNEGHKATVFNNIIYGAVNSSQYFNVAAPVANNGCDQGATYCNIAGMAELYNNTIEAGPTSDPSGIGITINKATTGVTIKNNHIITSATTPNDGVWGWGSQGDGNASLITSSNNLVQSRTTASGHGYTSLQTHVFSPVNASGGTVNTGSDLSSYFTADILGNTRTGIWDIGAYEYVPTTSVTSGSIGGQMR